jgi:hypothetical protein
MIPKVDAPVLLIIFNRPDVLKIVFDVIRKLKPAKLYISADGPRVGNNSDYENCNRSREIVKNVDWKCEMHYRFLDENLGCGYGPSSAITWAFENEDRLIIIEDDCVPSLSLLNYHNYLLEKYKDDTRIWLISGRSHHSNSQFFNDSDYIFSHYGASLGWSTWKRCWDHFDIEMKAITSFLKNGGAHNVFLSRKEGSLYNRKLLKWCNDEVLKTHAWDIQFGFAITANSGLSIVPAKNLVEHIGFIGTHYFGEKKNDCLTVCNEFEIQKEPLFVLPNKAYENFHFHNHIKKIFGSLSIYRKVIRKSKKILGWK